MKKNKTKMNRGIRVTNFYWSSWRNKKRILDD